ncbi:chondroitin sulfate synthase 2 isoform X2 [Chanos chanos]|uniref:Hexosyltransferase n=1 Tax=Chanos chanos TaxID=29144 RepID=A0A6J2WEN9_CHACN|nr:chondroitin sulfate synthase 2-like isoform X2 [Chanos chanos]
MKFDTFIASVRPFGPVVVGFTVGLTFSLLSVRWVTTPFDYAAAEDAASSQEGREKVVGSPAFMSTGANGNSDDFRPRIVAYEPAVKNKTKEPFRAKYISTELGIRERLFVGVLTSKNTINTLGVAVNHTIRQHLDSVVFFTGMHNHKLPHGFPVVNHGYEHLTQAMFQTVKHILRHYINEYDWFYFTQDDTYMQADRIKGLVSHLSVNQMLYMGKPVEFVDKQIQARYCHGGFGYLMSRSLLLHLKLFLGNCENSFLHARPDEWLGRCVVDYTNTSCVSEYEGLEYHHYESGESVDYSKEAEQFEYVLTVHPVSDPEHMYRLHKLFTHIELQKTYKEIEKLQAEIKNLSEVAYEGKRSMVWPIGINPSFRPENHRAVLWWDYFTEDLIYNCPDGSPRCELHGIDRMDVEDVIGVAVEEMNRKYKPIIHLNKQQLVNGYRRFDPCRGMEYILDLQLEVINQKGRNLSVVKRVHLLRPLSRVEMIATLLVRETVTVHIILPITSQHTDHISSFLDAYAKNAIEKSENAILTVLFIYDHFEAQEVNQHDIFSAVKNQIKSYERKFLDLKIPWISVETEGPSQIRYMDVISKQHPVDTLFFITTVQTNISSEFLSRCRMNTVRNRQVFFPIPLQDWNQDIACHKQAVPKMAHLNKDTDMFNSSSWNEACVYNSDYVAARALLASDVQEKEDLLENFVISDMFVRYSRLHVFRAVEPSLHQKCSKQTGLGSICY